MSPYVLLVFAFYAWLSRSRNARPLPPPSWPPRRSGPTSGRAEEDRRLGRLGFGGIYREILRVVLARPPRFVGTVFGPALAVSALSLAHAALVTRLLHAWGCRWAAFLLLALLDAACLSALLILSAPTAASLAISIASVYCCADDDRARDVLVRRLIQGGRCRRLVVNVFVALYVVLRCSAAAWAANVALQWLFALAEPGAPALDLRNARVWYLAGMLYLGADWQLAAVVSVLELDDNARRCFSRSSALLAGNFCAAAGVFAFLIYCFDFLHTVFGSLVLEGGMGLGFGLRVGTTLAVLAALCAVVVVAHPVVYFACKTYHGEVIEFGLGEHEPLLDANNNGVHLVCPRTVC